MARLSMRPPYIRTCFAAGTPVHTLSGARPIEAIQVGDRVLSQDAASGALSFQPVLFVHRNPPGKTLRIKLSGGDSVVCSVYHRFWRANLGWAQARELEPGDTLRHSGGIVRVEAVRTDSVQPLYNLDVANSRAPSSWARVNSWSTTIRCPITGSCRSTRCPSGYQSGRRRTSKFAALSPELRIGKFTVDFGTRPPVEIVVPKTSSTVAFVPNGQGSPTRLLVLYRIPK